MRKYQQMPIWTRRERTEQWVARFERAMINRNETKNDQNQNTEKETENAQKSSK